MIDAIYAFLERLGYPHPVHPLFVHLTIGMVTGALVFGIVARLWRSPSLWLTARNCITFALISAVPTALTGYMDWQYFFAGGWLFYFKVKLILAFVLLILLSLGVIVSRKAEARFLSYLDDLYSLLPDRRGSGLLWWASGLWQLDAKIPGETPGWRPAIQGQL